MKVNIELKTVSPDLVGEVLGEDIARKQVIKPLMSIIEDENELLIVQLPNHIQNISLSFVKGFLNIITQFIPKESFHNYIEIQGSPKALYHFDINFYH